MVARYCRWLDLDAVDLLMAVAGVKALLKDRSVGHALTAVGSTLLEHGAIPGHRVKELVAEADVEPAVVN